MLLLSGVLLLLFFSPLGPGCTPNVGVDRVSAGVRPSSRNLPRHIELPEDSPASSSFGSPSTYAQNWSFPAVFSLDIVFPLICPTTVPKLFFFSISCGGLRPPLRRL